MLPSRWLPSNGQHLQFPTYPMADSSSSRSPRVPNSSSTHSLSAYPPAEAEEYELNSPPPPHSAPLPPSRRPSQTHTHSHNNATTRARGFSIHSLSSHPNSLLFNDFGSSPVHRRSHLPSPKVNFTREEDDEGEAARIRRRSNGILSSLGAEDDSTWEIARSMKSSWRRKVFLLMEVSFGRARFIHPIPKSSS